MIRTLYLLLIAEIFLKKPDKRGEALSLCNLDSSDSMYFIFHTSCYFKKTFLRRTGPILLKATTSSNLESVGVSCERIYLKSS